MFAIAAIARNRVIGNGNSIPWRIADELRWFRRKTLGGVVIMGRKTFESLPRPLDGRINVVLTRHPAHLLADARFRERFGGALVGAAAHGQRDVAQLTIPKVGETQVRVVRSLESLARAGLTRHAWLCGGAQLYAQFLGQCSELYLSVVNREVEGDAFFPPFEHLFDLAGVVAEFPEFQVLRYVRNGVAEERGPGAARRKRAGRPGSAAVAPEGRASRAGATAPPSPEGAQDGEGAGPADPQLDLVTG